MALEIGRILIIGNLGYIGPVATRHFRSVHAELYIAGYDIGYFIPHFTHFGISNDTSLDVQHYGDVRNFNVDILTNYDSIIYLAAISNDPMGNAFEKPTLDINYLSAVEIARIAKGKGVKSFVYASSCSVYGFADGAPRVEESALNPLTAYAKSKVNTEIDLASLADQNFKITCLRFATACGFSDRLRLDLVLNDFVASAIVDKKINILSDGTPWRPLIHVKDMSRAMDWACHRLSGDHFLIVNTGSNIWNYQIKELAHAVQELFEDVQVFINPNAQPDRRSYKVNFDLFGKMAPLHQPQINLSEAVRELKLGLEKIHFSDRNFRASRYIRLKAIEHLIKCNDLDFELKIKR
ncbi:MAG: SDR family oxidoreductase [Saprospiraceae bacterium]|nr:SDR family oxidoreductase [Saprospiraceae bacterium]